MEFIVSVSSVLPGFLLTHRQLPIGWAFFCGMISFCTTWDVPLPHDHPYDIGPVTVDPFVIAQIPVGLYTDVVSAGLQLRRHGADCVRGADPHLEGVFGEAIPPAPFRNIVPIVPF